MIANLSELKWCLLSSVALMLQCLLYGIPVMSQRKKHFTPEFLTPIHPEKTPAKLGYPDTGSGRYSKQLTLSAWIEFMKMMRAHLNFVECLPVFVFLILSLGVFDPLTAGICGFSLVVLRLFHLAAYWIHPNLRIVGSLPTNLVLGYMTFSLATQFLK